MEQEIKVGKEHRPMSLAWIEAMSKLKIEQVFVVSVYDHQKTDILQQKASLFQS